MQDQTQNYFPSRNQNFRFVDGNLSDSLTKIAKFDYWPSDTINVHPQRSSLKNSSRTFRRSV